MKCQPARRIAHGVAALCVALASIAVGAGLPPEGIDDAGVADVVALVDHGDFHAAQARIDARSRDADLPAQVRAALAFQAERMRRMRLDFNLDTAALRAQLRRAAPAADDAQFAQWRARGELEGMLIDGEQRWFRGALANLFRLDPAARALRTTPLDVDASGLPRSIMDDSRADAARIIEAARRSAATQVLPQRVRVTQRLVVDADAVPAGKRLRAWLPFPREIPGQQRDIRLLASEPSQHVVAPAETLQRTVQLQRAARAGVATTFSITYEVTVLAQYHALDGARITAVAATPQLAPHLAERPPHIVFSQPLRVLSRQIVGSETNPYRIAQKIFAAVDEIPWAGAREYSTISQLGGYAWRAGHGDCGEQTLLAITLLRMNGIPARWQSGWTFTRGDYEDIHDWAQVYFQGTGWVPMDVTYGRLQSGDAALRDFYLGGLDNARIAFNDDYARAFVPAKTFFRSDTIDSQRGEVEWDGGNLYYDQWHSDFRWNVLDARR